MTMNKELIVSKQYQPAMPQCANWLINELMNNQELLEQSQSYAYFELEDQSFSPEMIQQLRDDHESLEDTPIYHAFYRASTVWFRKLLTASASLL